MSEGDLGLSESVSIALGGMIGGGIFAVLGVVAQIVGAATWFAFVLAGAVALCAGYSYDALNALSDEPGGSVTFVSTFLEWPTLAGVTGWTLLFGYVGSMAMYAYAFGSFFVGFEPIPESYAGVALRPFVSVCCIAGFVALNTLGARATGSAENVLVGLKVAVLLAFGVGGIAYGFSTDALEFGRSELAGFGPIMAAAISFVAFQGWQLLFYDQEGMSDPAETIRRTVYVSIPTAVLIYVLVAVATLSLAPADVIRQHPERALAVAADPFIPHGFLIVSLAALVSTGSAINATLFSSGYFAKRLLSQDLLPDRVGDPDVDGVPTRSLVVLGAITAAFTAYGSLGAITSFASLAFIVVFGGMSYLAFRQRAADRVHPLPPALGAVGSLSFLGLMLWRLYRAERGTFYALLLLSAAVLAVELLYFERETVRAEVGRVEDDVGRL